MVEIPETQEQFPGDEAISQPIPGLLRVARNDKKALAVAAIMSLRGP